MKASTDSDHSGRSLLLATAASAASFVVSLQFANATWWEQNPVIHPVMATVAAGVTFWMTWPRRSLVALWVFLPLAFAVITIIFVMGTIATQMPS